MQAVSTVRSSRIKMPSRQDLRSEIGMSNLGVRILYSRLNAEQDIWCERSYAPWVDMQEQMQKYDIPLLGQIPIVQSIRESGDCGEPAALASRPDGLAFIALAEKLAGKLTF